MALDQSRIDRDLREYDRARGIKPQASGPARPNLRLRLLAAAALFGGFAAVGVAQQWWLAYIDRPAPSASDGASTAVSDDQEMLRQEIAAYQARLRELGPEERKLYTDFVDQFSLDILANPALLEASRPRWTTSGASQRRLRPRLTRAAMAAWLAIAWMIERAGVTFAWFCVVLAGGSATAFALQRPQASRRLGEGSMLAARLWLWPLSLLCASVFAASGRNVWLDIPWYAWSAPLGLVLLLPLTDAGAETRHSWERSADVCLAPALSFGLVWLGSLLLAVTLG